MEATTQPRPYIPYSDSYYNIFLVPKGAAILVPGHIRTRPRSHTLLLKAGTWKVSHVIHHRDNSPDRPGLFEYVLLTDPNELTNTFAVNTDDHGILTKEGDELYDPELDARGNPWGWYGVDWYPDIDNPSKYVHLRRMEKVTDAADKIQTQMVPEWERELTGIRYANF